MTTYDSAPKYVFLMTPLPDERFYQKAKTKGFNVMVTEIEDDNPGTSIIVNSDWYALYGIKTICGNPMEIYEKVSKDRLITLNVPKVQNIPKAPDLENMVLA